MAKSLKLKQDDLSSVMAIHERITKDPFSHFTIESLAYKAGINKNKLTYGFKKLFGMGAYEYLVHLRMEKAKALLLDTDKDVQLIAIMSGYKTKSSFTTAFKKKHRISPTQWRKKNQTFAVH